MDRRCEAEAGGGGAGWLDGGGVQMGGYAVAGYLLYRFSQTLPALIRWPIRIFCSVTGLSALWSWVGRLVRTIAGIKRAIKWLSRTWRFIEACVSKLSWFTGVITGASRDRAKLLNSSSRLNVLSGRRVSEDLRLIILGSENRGQTPESDKSGTSTSASAGPLKESTKTRIMVDDEEMTVIDTPDLLGLWMSNEEQAREALRSLQLASPGPHAFLLVIQVPSLNRTVHLEARRALQTTLELFGEAASEYIIPVLAHTDHLDGTVERLLDADSGSLRRALSPCSQRPELVDTRPHCPLEEQRVMCRQLMERVTELKEMKGHFIHELQRRENRVKEELLGDMASALAGQLGHE